jgi:hypothetical protein
MFGQPHAPVSLYSPETFFFLLQAEWAPEPMAVARIG